MISKYDGESWTILNFEWKIPYVFRIEWKIQVRIVAIMKAEYTNKMSIHYQVNVFYSNQIKGDMKLKKKQLNSLVALWSMFEDIRYELCRTEI